MMSHQKTGAQADSAAEQQSANDPVFAMVEKRRMIKLKIKEEKGSLTKRTIRQSTDGHKTHLCLRGSVDQNKLQT